MYSEEALMALRMGATAVQMKFDNYVDSLHRGKHSNQGKKKSKKKQKVKHWKNN